MLWLLLLGWLSFAVIVSPVCGRLLASRPGRDVTAPEPEPQPTSPAAVR